MKTENPNDSAFFFDDGAFLNLEYVVYAGWSQTMDIDGHITTRRDVLRVLCVFSHDMDALLQRCSAAEHDRLQTALRVYHSKR